jgi:hypothetical protein
MSNKQKQKLINHLRLSEDDVPYPDTSKKLGELL